MFRTTTERKWEIDPDGAAIDVDGAAIVTPITRQHGAQECIVCSRFGYIKECVIVALIYAMTPSQLLSVVTT